MRTLFVSNLFPDTNEPGRGQDNAVLLRHLAADTELRVISPRPILPHRLVMRPFAWSARQEDACFKPTYPLALYVPKWGSRWNHKLMYGALRKPVARLQAAFPFDVVLCSWMYPDGWAVARLGAELGFPVVLIAQGSDLHIYLRMPARRRAILDAVRTAAGVITRSRQLADLLLAEGVPSEKVHPIYNGVNQDLYGPGVQSTARRQLGLPAEGKVILYVGNFLQVKNPGLLWETFKEMLGAAAGGPCHLVMVGDGPLRAPLIADATRADLLDRRVFFPGRQSPETVAGYMRAADVLCVPSWNEGVPNVILEAFATGLPVVATEVGGIPEVLNHPFLGRLVPPGNSEAMATALREALHQPPSAQEICNHAKQFSWAATAAAYAELLMGVRA